MYFFARLRSNMAGEGDFKSKQLNSVPFFIIRVLYRSLTFLIKRHVEKG